MTIEKRREREVEEMKELILSAASDIIASQGFDKLSIRKIAKKIEYSPSIIYHYFDDKEEILNVVMQKRKKRNSSLQVCLLPATLYGRDHHGPANGIIFTHNSWGLLLVSDTHT